MFSNTYKKIIRDISEKWIESSPRWIKVKELMNYSFEVDPYNIISEYNWIKFSWKYLCAELYWYLSMKLDTEFIWKYASLRTKIQNKDNTVNSNYWYIVLWRKSIYDDNMTNIEWVLNSLMNDINSRQAVMLYNDQRYQKQDIKDFPCTLYQLFYIRNNTLYCTVNMRSNDMFYWLKYDIVWFSFVFQYVYKYLLNKYNNLQIWNMTYIINNAHIYEKDYNKANNIIKSDISINYVFELNNLSNCILSNLDNDKDDEYYKEKIRELWINLTSI